MLCVILCTRGATGYSGKLILFLVEVPANYSRKKTYCIRAPNSSIKGPIALPLQIHIEKGHIIVSWY